MTRQQAQYRALQVGIIVVLAINLVFAGFDSGRLFNRIVHLTISAVLAGTLVAVTMLRRRRVYWDELFPLLEDDRLTPQTRLDALLIADALGPAEAVVRVRHVLEHLDEAGRWFDAGHGIESPE